MASLNAEAPEFVPLSSVYTATNDTLHYNYQSLLFYPYYPSHHYSCLSSYPVIRTSQASMSLYCNSDGLCVGSQWQLGPQQMRYDNAEEAVVDKEVVSMKVVSRAGRKGVKSRFCNARREGCLKEGIEAINSGNRDKVIWRPKGLKEEMLIERKFVESIPIERGGTYTTVMIRNIPNKYTREMLLDLLDKHCMIENQRLQGENSTVMDESSVSAFDFVYLPIDFGSKCNKGYAFVNFTNSSAVWKLYVSLHQQKWNVLNSKKICEITYARIQGKDALVKHFQKSMFACETDEFLPACFDPHRDGSVKSVVQTKLVGRRLTSSWPPT